MLRRYRLATDVGILAKLFGRKPRTRIADVAEGEHVIVRGRVTCRSPIVAPYTGRPCAYWRFEVHQLADSVITSTLAVDFRLEDATGVADVIVEVCSFDVVVNYVEMSRATNLSAKARSLFAQFGFPHEIAQIAQVNVGEAIVAVGEEIEVEGTATREPLPPDSQERGYREGGGTKLVFSRGAVVRGLARDSFYIGARD